MDLFSNYTSPVYDSKKLLDFIVADGDDERFLGLELKYLKGTGSLVKPKALIDAIDFSSRPIDCIYVIDGLDWTKGKNVEFLDRWWGVTNTEYLIRTLDDYFR